MLLTALLTIGLTPRYPLFGVISLTLVLPLQGKDNSLRQFCQPEMTDQEWRSLDILNLVKRKLCPPYLLPSTSFNGLCLPNYALPSDVESSQRMATIVERIQVSNVQMLVPDQVLEGSLYSRAKLTNLGFWEKSLQVFITQ